MSDLGAIFHVKKAGTQYDAHAYTTTDECPYPNLKIKFKGQQAYVKMEGGKGNGDVPCYVKDKAGAIYQVRKEAVPSGSLKLQGAYGEPHFSFTVPNGITIIKVSYDGRGSPDYIAVVPNSYHDLYFFDPDDGEGLIYLYCSSHRKQWMLGWMYYRNTATLEWSSEINKHSPTVYDN